MTHKFQQIFISGIFLTKFNLNPLKIIQTLIGGIL